MPPPGLTSRYWCLAARYNALGIRTSVNAAKDQIESAAKNKKSEHTGSRSLNWQFCRICFENDVRQHQSPTRPRL